MWVSIDTDRCIGAGLCIAEAPEVFEFDEDFRARLKGISVAIQPGERVPLGARWIDDTEATSARIAADYCPARCIYLQTKLDSHHAATSSMSAL